MANIDEVPVQEACMRRRHLIALSATALAAPALLARPAHAEIATRQLNGYRIRTFTIGTEHGLHDVACDAAGLVWATGQRSGKLIRLDPRDGSFTAIDLGPRAAPHGVTIGPDRAVWITEGGQNAIARHVPDDGQGKVELFMVPRPDANLNTAVFDKDGTLWFTGQSGVIGRCHAKTHKVEAWESPRGYGPYGIACTPKGSVWYVSLAGNYLAQIDLMTGKPRVVEPPTPQQGARRVWSDSQSRLWISEWNSGQVSRHDPADGSWKSWKLPGDRPRAYAVYVDEQDGVWLTDFAANTIVRFDPKTESFLSFPSDKPGANIRQLHGRRGEVWGAESGTGRIVVIDRPNA
jgi:virginiamycin B lyase